MVMEPISVCKCNGNTAPTSPLLLLFNTNNTLEKKNSGHCRFPTTTTRPFISTPSSLYSSTSWFRIRVNNQNGDLEEDEDEDESPLTTSSAYRVLGLHPPCSSPQLKAAFRTKVKQFHPDVMRGAAGGGGPQNSDIMIRRLIQAYQILSNYTKSDIIERECVDPFDQPECEAFDVFVNEVLCIGKGCPCSCVQRAPHAFKFSSETGTARATSQGHGEDYKVDVAVGQCPKSCIHYVTPLQRIILEELLHSILNMPYDTSSEAELLYSLIVKAKYENNRYQVPKRGVDCKA